MKPRSEPAPSTYVRMQIGCDPAPFRQSMEAPCGWVRKKLVIRRLPSSPWNGPAGLALASAGQLLRCGSPVRARARTE